VVTVIASAFRSTINVSGYAKRRRIDHTETRTLA